MRKLALLACMLILTACGSTKRTKTTAEVEDIATAKLIANYYNNSFDFTTLAARMKLRYKDKKNSQSVTVSLRMEKDKTIWMSASILGISLAKAKITPDRVSYYEKITRSYFDGDFEFLSQYVGVQMDFDQLQRLLIGQTVYDLRDGSYTMEQLESQYKITPRKQLDILQLFFFLEPEQFLLQKQRVAQPQEGLSLDVDYTTYQEVDGMIFPKDLHIEVLKKADRSVIDIEYKSIDRNQTLRFPFKIPSGYKEIRLKP